MQGATATDIMKWQKTSLLLEDADVTSPLFPGSERDEPASERSKGAAEVSEAASRHWTKERKPTMSAMVKKATCLGKWIHL